MVLKKNKNRVISILDKYMIDKNYCRLSDSSTYVDDSKPKSLKIDKYTVCPQEVLGHGSFSSVYMCRDEQGNKCAVKILKKRDRKSDSTVIKVAKAQAKTMRKLNHPNIVRYLGSYESERHYYILFEYCEGKTLRELHRQQGSMGQADLNNLAYNLIKALQYLHEKKIMHRDIKPENIKIYKGKLKLLDFGFACELPHSEKTVLHQSIGTPSYMSPQMLQRKNYTSNSDIWSLGVVLYEAAFGRLPWTGRNQAQLLKNIQMKQLVFPKKPLICETLHNLIKGCLVKKGGERISWGLVFEYLKMKPMISYEGENCGSKCGFCSWF